MQNMQGRMTRSHFINTYHHSSGQLFQFVLSEFLQTFSHIIEIEKIGRQNADYSEIMVILQNMCGPSQEYSPFFPWGIDNGPLRKLNSYLELLTSQQNSTTVHSLMRDGIQLWDGALHSIQTIETRRKRQINESLADLDKTAQQLKKTLTRVIPLFSKDENVLYYLLRHQVQFAAIYGSEYLRKLFKKMYPAGLDAAENFVNKAYKQRSFHNILPLIKGYFSQLEGKMA